MTNEKPNGSSNQQFDFDGNVFKSKAHETVFDVEEGKYEQMDGITIIGVNHSQYKYQIISILVIPANVVLATILYAILAIPPFAGQLDRVAGAHG